MPADGPIPAHLLGNIWAQEWGNIYPLVAPPGSGGPGYDLTALLKAKKVDEKEMVRYGERFFTSLGFDPLPETFWERSLFVQPKDRDVVCHASAWDIDDDDYRIKMCIEVNERGLRHHPPRAGPQLLPARLPAEAAAAVPQQRQRRLPRGDRRRHRALRHPAVPGEGRPARQGPGTARATLEYLLRMALDKIAFLPFGLLIDQWRWKVFSGEVTPADYNKAWWELRRKYQGVAPAEPRGEECFDPGAKYHVPANVPYTRYFLARILQFQFHRALCREAGYTGPLHQCSIYGNKAAGAKLNAMLEMGASRPWPEALEAMTGEKQMDATAILDYFKPLMAWLEKENKGRKAGWK